MSHNVPRCPTKAALSHKGVMCKVRKFQWKSLQGDHRWLGSTSTVFIFLEYPHGGRNPSMIRTSTDPAWDFVCAVYPCPSWHPRPSKTTPEILQLMGCVVVWVVSMWALSLGRCFIVESFRAVNIAITVGTLVLITPRWAINPLAAEGVCFLDPSAIKNNSTFKWNLHILNSTPLGWACVDSHHSHPTFHWTVINGRRGFYHRGFTMDYTGTKVMAIMW